MAIDSLNIGKKEPNQGINDSGRLSALEFNQLIAKINEVIDFFNKTVYLTQAEYDALVLNEAVLPGVEYNIYEE